jgi:signal peptidase I
VKRITKPLLIILATVAICMAGFQALNSYTNFKAIPVTSSVMEPAIFRGSLMLMEKTPEKDIKSGDIIAVGLPNGQGHALGRLIQSNQMADGYYTLTFKGDNRTLPENFPYTIKDSTYVNKAAIPLIGFLVVFLSSPFGLILFTGAAIYFAWYYLFKMHDRLSWAERNVKRVSYNRQVALEVAQERQKYGGLEVFFPEEEYLTDDDYTDDDYTDSDAYPETELIDLSQVKEQTR